MNYGNALVVPFTLTRCKLGVMKKEYERNQNKNSQSPRFALVSVIAENPLDCV